MEIKFLKSYYVVEKITAKGLLILLKKISQSKKFEKIQGHSQRYIIAVYKHLKHDTKLYFLLKSGTLRIVGKIQHEQMEEIIEDILEL